MKGYKAKRCLPDWLKACLGVGLGLVVQLLIFVPTVVLFYYFILPDLPSLLRFLPSDQAMIAHFRKHRADFERLAQIYREDPSVPTDVVGQLLPTPEVKVIMDRINVTSIEGDNILWMPPDPYSRDPNFLKEKSKLELKWHSPEGRKFSGVIFHYAHEKVIRLIYGQEVCKGYHYLPFVPEVRNGKLIVPACFLGGLFFAASTLNAYPPDFATGDTAYREIEPHWFVRMIQYDR